MEKAGTALLGLGLLAFGLVGPLQPDSPWVVAHEPYSQGEVLKAYRLQVLAAYRALPLRIEANHGQTDSRVKFLSRGSSYTLFLTSTEAVLALRRPTGPPTGHRAQAESGAVVRMKMVGANPRPRVMGLDELPGKSNFFIGNDPTKWRTNIPTYARVKYRDVYPGVDLIYYGNQGQLEWDFVVAPNAGPSVISMNFEGAEKISLDDQGDLILKVGNRENPGAEASRLPGTKRPEAIH